ncbi:MAG: DUF6624 domain-containing protein [Bacteroidia bacterium]
MKIISTIILFLLSSPLFAQIDTLMADSISRMAFRDKWVRHTVDSVFKKFGKDSPQWKQAWKDMEETDKSHAPALNAILDKYWTYPGADKVGEDASHYFWQLVLHQDKDTSLQMKTAVWMKLSVEGGQAPPNDYAYLVDRSLINRAKKQVYGTQCYYDPKKKKYVPNPIQDAANVDTRRRSMHLPVLSEYMSLMNNPKEKKKLQKPKE